MPCILAMFMITRDLCPGCGLEVAIPIPSTSESSVGGSDVDHGLCCRATFGRSEGEQRLLSNDRSS